jgi:hypothetical protein
MNEKKIRKIFFLTAAAILTGCPEQVGEQCPSGATSLGQFNLFFNGQHPSGECKVQQADGGANPLVQDDGGYRSGTFCYSTIGDGGALIQFVVPQSGTRSSALLDGGGFLYPATSAGQPGLCDADGGSCSFVINEVFAGYLLTGPDAGFAVQSDGGLPIVTAVSGVLIDNLTSANTTNCVCNIPCSATWNISGTRF